MSSTSPGAGAPGRRLGRIRPTAEQLRRVIPLASFVRRGSSPPLPDRVDYASIAPRALNAMLANDQWGDCTIAAALHGLTLARAVRPGGHDTPATDDEAVRQYHTICGRGDPGCVIIHVLDYLRDTGLAAAGVTSRADGYAWLAPGDIELARLAVYLLGGIHLGINLPQEWYERASSTSVWAPTDSPIIGGHSVQVVGYEPDGVRIATWGQTPLMTWAAYADARWVEERYAILHADWYDARGLDAHGVDVTALRAALADLQAGRMPTIPPASPPTPPPPTPPTPPPPPTQWTITGSLSILGLLLPIVLTAHEGSARQGTRALPWVRIIADIAALVSAATAHDWVTAIARLEQLLADLGVQIPDAEYQRLASAITSAAQTSALGPRPCGCR